MPLIMKHVTTSGSKEAEASVHTRQELPVSGGASRSIVRGKVLKTYGTGKYRVMLCMYKSYPCQRVKSSLSERLL